MTRARLAVLGCLLVVLLGVLVAGLSGVQFRGGRFSEVQADEGQPGGSVYLGNMEWFLYAMMAILYAVVAVEVIRAIIDPERRRKALRRLLVLATMILVLYAVRDGFQFAAVEDEPEPGPPAVLPWRTPEFVSGGEEPSAPPGVPDWAAYLGAAALTVAAGLWAWRRFGSRPSDEAGDIRDALAAASADLTAGLPVSDVVVRCWARMVAVLSAKKPGADAPAVTPRELAHRLARLGFGEHSVLVLTKLFEEVRYGHKDSEPRRAEALAALAAIERAYG